jgi:hypothetical protein
VAQSSSLIPGGSPVPGAVAWRNSATAPARSASQAAASDAAGAPEPDAKKATPQTSKGKRRRTRAAAVILRAPFS